MNFEESRLDKYIKRLYGKMIPQSMIEKALRNKDITVNGQKATASQKVTDQDQIFVHPAIERSFAAIFCSPEKEKSIGSEKYRDQFKAMIIFENENLVIVNKPSGLAVQLGSKTNTALDVMAKEYNPEARLVHRIDKETSGITVFAKNIETSRLMLHLFKNKQVQKKYMAIVSGELPMREGVINKPLSRNKETVLVDFDNGKEAITEFKFVKKVNKFGSLISVIPLTGRTHQIRVHLSSIDCPIVGDNKYMGKRSKHLCLHAAEICFVAQRGEKISVKAPLPDYFK